MCSPWPQLTSCSGVMDVPLTLDDSGSSFILMRVMLVVVFPAAHAPSTEVQHCTSYSAKVPFRFHKALPFLGRQAMVVPYRLRSVVCSGMGFNSLLCPSSPPL